MKNELPYMLEPGRDDIGRDCFRVCRKDNSLAGYLRKVADGWEIVDDLGANAELCEKRVFVEPHEAARLVHMRGRAYHRFFDMAYPSERLEVRVGPRCEVWSGTIWKDNRCVGGANPQHSLEEAKYLVLRQLDPNESRSAFDHRQLAQQEWPEIEINRPSVTDQGSQFRNIVR